MAAKTLKQAANDGNPNHVGDVMRDIALGDLLDVVEVTKTISSGTVMTLAGTDAEPAILAPISVRVVTGTAAGPRQVTDDGGTATTGVALLSDDGLTLTFEAAITVALLRYVRRPAKALSAAFVQQPQ